MNNQILSILYQFYSSQFPYYINPEKMLNFLLESSKLIISYHNAGGRNPAKHKTIMRSKFVTLIKSYEFKNKKHQEGLIKKIYSASAIKKKHTGKSILHAVLSHLYAIKTKLLLDSIVQKSTVLFDSGFEALLYIHKFKRFFPALPIEAAFNFTLDKQFSQCDSIFWSAQLAKSLKHKSDFYKLCKCLSEAYSIQSKSISYTKGKAKKISSFKLARTINISALYALCFSYKNSEKNKAAALLFSKYGKSQEDFDYYLKLKKTDSRIALPEVTLEYEGFTLFKLQDSNPLIAVLGEKVAGCSSVGKAGERYIDYAIQSHNCGVYGITNTKRELVTYIITWRKGDTVVFDSIESSGQVFKKGALRRIDAILIEELIGKLREYKSIARILVGVSGGQNSIIYSDNDSDIKFFQPDDFCLFYDSKEAQPALTLCKSILNSFSIENEWLTCASTDNLKKLYTEKIKNSVHNYIRFLYICPHDQLKYFCKTQHQLSIFCTYSHGYFDKRKLLEIFKLFKINIEIKPITLIKNLAFNCNPIIRSLIANEAMLFFNENIELLTIEDAIAMMKFVTPLEKTKNILALWLSHHKHKINLNKITFDFMQQLIASTDENHYSLIDFLYENPIVDNLRIDIKSHIKIMRVLPKKLKEKSAVHIKNEILKFDAGSILEALLEHLESSDVELLQPNINILVNKYFGKNHHLLVCKKELLTLSAIDLIKNFINQSFSTSDVYQSLAITNYIRAIPGNIASLCLNDNEILGQLFNCIPSYRVASLIKHEPNKYLPLTLKKGFFNGINDYLSLRRKLSLANKKKLDIFHKDLNSKLHTSIKTVELLIPICNKNPYSYRNILLYAIDHNSQAFTIENILTLIGKLKIKKAAYLLFKNKLMNIEAIRSFKELSVFSSIIFPVAKQNDQEFKLFLSRLLKKYGYPLKQEDKLDFELLVQNLPRHNRVNYLYFVRHHLINVYDENKSYDCKKPSRLKNIAKSPTPYRRIYDDLKLLIITNIIISFKEKLNNLIVDAQKKSSARLFKKFKSAALSRTVSQKLLGSLKYAEQPLFKTSPCTLNAVEIAFLHQHAIGNLIKKYIVLFPELKASLGVAQALDLVVKHKKTL